MRIETQLNESVTKSSSISKLSETKIAENSVEKDQSIENSIGTGVEQIPKEKLQQAVDTINDFLHINHNTSKFVLHDGLDRYFVQVVDVQTDEVVKEIPPKKLLDAFYEMQKLLGMIVDEKI
ncbi:flagellar protein FlaG [Lysinibacillus sp. JNUCC 51]|uniref:flagellar protein FlaG n=1 Tax=Lysinibacillus sp. JNUCC-51 TaxID=2792479 RepID=UPI001937527A|nr:flagellar protein FlaG [Lysinibacillus sp. JNUCC-51]